MGFSLGNYECYQKKFQIVVIDDHKLVRENTVNLIRNVFKYLKINAYGILEGSDGVDLLNIVRLDKENKIKYIFIDENMYYLNGSEAVSKVRKFEEYKKINRYEYISITAFDEENITKKILDSGVNSILYKSCSKSDLTKILEKLSKM